jgi:two-component system response regulator YesN
MATGDGFVPRVLIVDDDRLVRSFLRTALAPIAVVEEAPDAEQALEILKTRGAAIDVALVDQVLPRRSGLEVLSVAKRKCSWIAVAILTGFGSEELAVRALRAGASDYLRKPINLTALLETLDRLVTARYKGTRRAASFDRLGRTEAHPSPVHPNIGRALMFVSEHFTEAITLASVASEAELSRFHFCRLFHREVGIPFQEYLYALRVRRAKILLADRCLRVSEVAYAVGFNDLSHFDRTFRKMVGRSPSEYRAFLQCT